MSVDLSIIIPTYNCAAVLHTAIVSVLNQTYQDWELLLIDGQSDDQTISIIKDYSHKDERVRWISEPDKGLYDAMNKGVAMAKGEWLYFMGSDDWLFDETVLTQIFSNEEVRTNNTHMICCRVMRYGRPSEIQPYSIPEALYDTLNHQSIIYRRLIAIKFPFQLKYKIAADQVQFLHIISSDINTVSIDVILANYAEGGLSSQKIDMIYADKKKDLIDKLYPDVDELTKYSSLRYVALCLLKYGNFLKGLYWLFKGGIMIQEKRNIFFCIKHRVSRLLRIPMNTI